MLLQKNIMITIAEDERMRGGYQEMAAKGLSRKKIEELKRDREVC